MKLKHFSRYTMLEFVIFITLTTLETASGIEEIRILNGTSAPQGKYPTQVSIKRKNGRSFCGGSILNADYVLTAAHCLLGETVRGLRVVSSTVNLTAGGREHKVVTAVVHHNFTLLFSERIQEYAINDIALLKVKPSFNMESGKEAAVTLPTLGQQIQSGENATVIGWGYTKPHGLSSPQSLQELGLTVVSDEECEAAYFGEGIVHPQLHLCAGAEPAGDCNGDSGGPLFVAGVQVGVVSFGADTCGAKPGVYTEVSNYVDWIKSHAV